MAQTGINLENVKKNNRGAILRLLNTRGAMSRKDIAVELGLTPASVTQISNEMIGSGILMELGEAQEDKRAGRKKILLDINYEVRYAIAISVELSEVSISICTLKGSVIASSRVPKSGTTKDPEALLHQIATDCKLLLWENNIFRSKILGVGVAVSGPLDAQKRVAHRPENRENGDWKIVDILQKDLEFPVVLSNNVNAFAEAELVFGNETGDDIEIGFYVKWGPGVGAAIMINHQIYEGAGQGAAEIGHIRAEQGGLPCRCGRNGCLETVVSTHAITNRVRANCTEKTMPELYRMIEGDIECITPGNILWWAQASDEKLWEIFDHAIEQMSHVVCSTMTIINPNYVILFGYMFEIPHFQEHFIECCKQYDASYDEAKIMKSKLMDKMNYIGPLAVVVDRLFLSGAGLGIHESL